MTPSTDGVLLTFALTAIAALVLLVTRWRWNPFLALTLTSLLIAPLITPGSLVNRELLVLAIGFGSLFLSHLNDGGFWIVKESLGLTVRETLQTWTITETIIGIAGLLLTLLAAALLPSYSQPNPNPCLSSTLTSISRSTPLNGTAISHNHSPESVLRKPI